MRGICLGLDLSNGEVDVVYLADIWADVTTTSAGVEEVALESACSSPEILTVNKNSV